MSKPKKNETDTQAVSKTLNTSVAPEKSDTPKKCPLHTNTMQRILNPLLIIFGTLGLYYLNLWFAIFYLLISVVFFMIIMPTKACQYCYFNSEGITLDQWKKEYAKLHEANWKKFGLGLFTVWLLPVIGIIISFFLEFEILALVTLILYISIFTVSQINFKKKVCPKCEMLPICPMHNK